MTRSRSLIHPLAWLIFSVLAAFAVSMLIVMPVLDPPEAEIYQLFAFMVATGGVTVTLVYVLYRRGVIHWFSSLRWTLLATIVLTVLLIFINVLVTAQLMFISTHDLVLTTALLIFASLIATTSVYFISSALTERISALERAVAQLAKGDLQTRLGVMGNDELANLATAFNAMAQSLHDADEAKRKLQAERQELFRWVSHDLRTPLASMRVLNEALIDGVVSDPETVTRYLYSIQHEIKHMSRLIDDLFDLTKLDAHQFDITFDWASLRDLLSDTLESMAARAARADVKLSGRIDGDLDMVYMATDKIQRVLTNLIDNALNHTPPGGTVLVTAARGAREVVVSVHNTGSYIPAADLEKVFTSFYRGEPSRARKDDGVRGTGLGLAIARGFVKAHGGAISADSDPASGTTFTFTLPQV